MTLYKNGEYMAFEVLYKRYESHVFTYLKKRLNNPDIVSDIFQNIFIKFHKSKNNYNPKYPLLKWIYTICRSELLDHLKKPKTTEIEFNESHRINSESSTHTINADLSLENESTLSQNEQKALQLRYYSDKDFIEISQILNTSPSNARKLISRGLKKLKLKYVGDVK